MDANPWLVENIQTFSFLNCPECTFKSKGGLISESIFNLVPYQMYETTDLNFSLTLTVTG